MLALDFSILKCLRSSAVESSWF